MSNLNKLINANNGFNSDEISLFDNANIENIVYHTETRIVSLELSIDKFITYKVYLHFLNYLKSCLKADILLTINYHKKLSYDFFISFIDDFLKDNEIFDTQILLSNYSFKLIFANKESFNKFNDINDKFLKVLDTLKLNKDFSCEIKKEEHRALGINDIYKFYKINNIKQCLNNIRINAEIFKIEDSVSKRLTSSSKGQETIYYYIKDDTGPFLATLNVNKNNLDNKLNEFKIGDYCIFCGNVVLNNHTNNHELLINRIISSEKPLGRLDTAKVKRIELHAHTKMSEMDGVSSAEEYIKTAAKWGWEAMAFTDHAVVHEYPEIQNISTKINKDSPFKPIYGIEMYMVDPILKIIKNPDSVSLDRDYVVFDLETTGLSNRYNEIIEFGGVKIHDGIITEHLQLFFKPSSKLSEFTKNLTNITDNDVENGFDLSTGINKILNFFSNSCLVAHNAKFDIGFINAALRKLNLNEIKNPYIDTLDLARTLLKERKSYRLGKVASFYKIEYDDEIAHRADYDAEITANIFIQMINQIKDLNFENPIRFTNELQKLSGDDAFKKVNKYHVCLLAKNQQGIKDIFKLVSLSHTDYLVFGGKVTTKNDEFMAEQRIPREKINELRKNILVGSACCNGEIFELASTSSKLELLEAMKFYDYIEIQPLENYRFLVENHSIESFDILKRIVIDIIECANELNIPVVATGDAHYVEPEEKIFRDIYIQAQGIGGTIHPLYIYDLEKRKKAIAPDQHLRTTDEMLEAFSFLNKEEAFRIVVTNTHKIADQIEIAYPCKDKLYTPSIEGADQKLTELCYKNLHQIYGKNPDKLIVNRLDKELNSVINNGYGVIYYTAHLMVKDSLEHGYLVGSRGSVGSSFLATMAEITEVNPLPPHYVCPKCHHFEWISNTDSGYDSPNKLCPECQTEMKPNGQNIPFETFLGFNADKVPDIDLNFSSDYQAKAMLYTRSVFGKDNCYRAGTISGVQEKTAYGYIKGYEERLQKETKFTEAERVYLATGCTDVKRTTGQHAGGIIVIPKDMDVLDFTPVQYPANNPDSEWLTTHFDFHSIHDNVLKLDNLGHVAPTFMKLLEKVSGIDVRSIPLNDPKTISIFNSPKALNIIDKSFKEKTGALGTPEFGTKFVRGILVDTKPQNYSDLVRISGLSHGTGVWANNAKELVSSGLSLRDVICCRDDIMTDLIKYDLPPKDAFDIMESVRKGKGLKEEWKELMRSHNVPEWYIDSCLKIKYMFPKAHAVAYVMDAVRTAWFKVYKPLCYYISFFSLRCDAYEISTMINSQSAVKIRLDDILTRQMSKDREIRNSVTNKEIDLITTLEVTNELYARGYGLSNLSLQYSQANEFIIDPNNPNNLIPSFVTIDGLGYNVAKSIVDARNEKPFISKKDLLNRTQVSKSLLDKLDELHVLDGLSEENQLSLF